MLFCLIAGQQLRAGPWKVGIAQIRIEDQHSENLASANSDSWPSKTIAGVTINTGDEIQVSVRVRAARTGKLDYVQVNTAKGGQAR